MAKLVINVLGAPNSRKSTTAFALFAALKKLGINCEIAAEVAKEYVFENNKNGLDYQLIVWAEQAYRLNNAANHADVVITDAPLLLGLVYLTEASVSLCNVVMEEHQKYTNLNILMPFYPDTYKMEGRVHSVSQAAIINTEILDFLTVHDIPYLLWQDYTEDELISIVLEALEQI